MDRLDVPYTTYLQETLALFPEPGLLLATAGADGKANAMAIGWGTVGVVWSKPIFTVLVRPSRYTYQLLAESDSFTVCVPTKTLYKAVNFCGAHSGRDCDKLQECGLTALPSTRVAAPGIAECPVIYECHIVHTNDVIPANLAADIQARAYRRGDFHRIYYGEILTVRASPHAADELLGG